MYYNSPYNPNATGNQLQAMQYSNPMYNQMMNNAYQQNMYPQQPQQPQQNKIGSPAYDFFGKRVTSFQEVKDCPIPLDGKPMIFIDDEHSKLYFKYLDSNGNQTVQSFMIDSNEANETKPDVKKETQVQQVQTQQIDTSVIIQKIEEVQKNFVNIDDFTRLRKEFEAFKEGLS